MTDTAMEKKIDAILKKLTVEQKAALLHGRTGMTFGNVSEEVPEGVCADGPQGIRKEDGTRTTSLPAGIALAATWDPGAAEKFGGVIAREALALGIHASLGPGMNLMRSPLCGRNFEYYGEDPVLSGKIAAGYVRGCQAYGVAATPKHLALNSQEQCRTTASSNCNKKTMRELYLEAFEIAIREGHPWMLMSSYNRINGVYASQCAEIQQKFAKDECGFDGVLVSDWGGTHAAKEALRGGLDLEMGGSPRNHMAVTLPEELKKGEITPEELDEHVRRVLRLLLRTHDRLEERRKQGEVATERHARISRTLATEGTVLLKNENGLLPLEPGKYRRILVCGPAADFRHNIGLMELCGGSGAVHPAYEVTALEAIRARAGGGCTVDYAPGVLFPQAEDFPAEMLESCRCSYFESREALHSGVPPFLQEEPATLSFHWSPYLAADYQGCREMLKDRTFAFRLNARIRARRSGEERLGGCFSRITDFVLKIDGKSVWEKSGNRLTQIPGIPVAMEAGKCYELECTGFRADPGNADLRLQLLQDRAALGKELLEKAAQADLVLFVGGSHHLRDRESIGWGYVEGADIPDLELPEGQSELISALAEVNPRVVVALQNGSVLNVEPWIGKVPALAEFWYPGQEAGRVIADVLWGDAAPGGRLPCTWAKRLSDYACHANGAFPGDVWSDSPHVEYPEGIFIGYRHFDRAKIAPRFPFGFGLSYTAFSCESHAPEVTGRLQDHSLRITLTGKVTNTGKRSGSEVLQLYVAQPECRAEKRPEKVLRAFVKFTLVPGKSREFSLTLGWRDFAFYDSTKECFAAESGRIKLLLGRSAADIIAEYSVEI